MASTNAANCGSVSAFGSGALCIVHNLGAVFFEESTSALFVLRWRLTDTKAVNALQELFIFTEGFIVAKLRERGQACGLNVIIVRLVEQYFPRAFLQRLRLERI